MPAPSGPCGASLRLAIADGLGAKVPEAQPLQPLGLHRVHGSAKVDWVARGRMGPIAGASLTL
jgi:hypothetical protein